MFYVLREFHIFIDFFTAFWLVVIMNKLWLMNPYFIDNIQYKPTLTIKTHKYETQKIVELVDILNTW